MGEESQPVEAQSSNTPAPPRGRTGFLGTSPRLLCVIKSDARKKQRIVGYSLYVLRLYIAGPTRVPVVLKIFLCYIDINFRSYIA